MSLANKRVVIWDETNNVALNLDATGDPQVDVVTNANAPGTATILHGQTTVTTAGTEVPLIGSTTVAKWVIVKALATNTGNIFVGANPVTSSTGYVLAPGEAAPLTHDDLNEIYIDSAVNGEGVSYIGGN